MTRNIETIGQEGAEGGIDVVSAAFNMADMEPWNHLGPIKVQVSRHLHGVICTLPAAPVLQRTRTFRRELNI
eukprot:712663-Pleurochrysis_carterae.AAC.2